MKLLAHIKAEWRSVGFMIAHCLSSNCNVPTLVFPGELHYGIPFGYHEEELQ